MSPNELRASCLTLGWSEEQAARFAEDWRLHLACGGNDIVKLTYADGHVVQDSMEDVVNAIGVAAEKVGE